MSLVRFPVSFVQLGFLVMILMLTAARSEVSVPSVFGSNMVLQRDKNVPVWGWARPGEKVTVEIAGQKVETVTGSDGKWQLQLAPLAVRESGDMTVKGSNTLTFTNVAVGEVWFCSGQSNMAMFLSDMGEEAVASAEDPQLRLYWVSSTLSGTPLNDRNKLHWQASTPKSAYKFSAQGHYFGRTLRKELKIPVGLIASAIGGSRIEPWIPAEVCAAKPELTDSIKRITDLNAAYLNDVEKSGMLKDWLPTARKAVEQKQALPPLPSMSEAEMKKMPVHQMTLNKQEPSTLYNGMVNHIMGFALRGVLWQQGFSNQADGYGYLPKIRALVDFWRSQWGADIPIYYAQYPACGMISPEFRDVQTAMLQAIPNSAMVVCHDLSYDFDLHPKNKDKVGERLAILALANTYKVPVKAFTGPIYKGIKMEGDKIRISFDNTGSGLVSRDGQALSWFEIAATKGDYVPAIAEIEGNDVLVSNPSIKAPAKVRYAWDALALSNLMNKEGYPASLFRSQRD